MNQSKRFILVSLFAGLTLSALGANLVALVDKLPEPEILAVLIYPISFLLFIIKYFADDLVEEGKNEIEKSTSSSLYLLILTWISFFFTALFVSYVIISAILWVIGLICVSIFINYYKNKNLFALNRYLFENFIIIILLIIFLCIEFIALSPYFEIIDIITTKEITCYISKIPLLILVLFFLIRLIGNKQSK